MTQTTPPNPSNALLITAQVPDDLGAILRLHEKAFNSMEEVRLVETLSWQVAFNPTLSRVAKMNEKVVGHILFSDVYTDSAEERRIVALAPLAVLPDYQGQGVGGALINEGFFLLEQQGYVGIVVLGDPAYYTRHGFTHAKVAHIQSPYQCDHYMGYELLPDALSAINEIRYLAAFSAFERKSDNPTLHPIVIEEGDVIISRDSHTNIASKTGYRTQ